MFCLILKLVLRCLFKLHMTRASENSRVSRIEKRPKSKSKAKSLFRNKEREEGVKSKIKKEKKFGLVDAYIFVV
jgi:hypothetical protein